MKQSKTLITSAILIALGMSSFAAAERPPECAEGEATLLALGVDPMALIALEESMQPPPDDAPEEDREAFDEMMDSMVADQFFGGDMTQVEDMFDSLPDLDPEECFGDMDHGNMGPNGMDHGNMGPDGMDHGNMGPDGMPMTMAVDPAACEAATTMIIDAGIDPRELAEMFMPAGPAGPESDPMPKLADTYFDGDIEAAIALMDGLSQTNTDPVMCGHIEPPM